ncbi:CoA transferase [Pseudofrankia asymbiotica]|uniref:CoA transferase n=1 Tax=Pseudofrankia asymbiotica TaxID=1834516 RepID=A0A1V2I0K7_9ACTN|nr:CoA transferase [Pseudofrankia asymbiotica]ONH22990.1 hypothetical protein BL253_34230 [Pseudofrankia asymbiotica]
MPEVAPLAGVRVLEVATHVFVPMASAVLGEWGARVVKVEHPTTGDPYRALTTVGLHNVYRGVDAAGRTGTRVDRQAVWNPLMLTYRTADDRYVALMMLSPDRHWPGLCAALGRPELAADPRFADLDARRRNAAACVEELDTLFATRPLAAWRAALAGFAGEWAPVQTPREVHDDPQVLANGYVADVEMGAGFGLPMVTAPVQFDGRPGQPTRAPEHGEHTEAVLLELGLTWREITELKERGAVL